jgi:riboflavin synthase
MGAKAGDSIAVNGVCLTATSIDGDSFGCMAVGETLERTSLSGLVAGDPVNLERPMPADGRFDGHIVQGHVDGIGTILAVTGEGDAKRIRVGVATPLSPYVVEKGSVTVDGTSLTITATSDPNSPETWFEVVLIPHTLENTVFGTRSAGDKVNVEVDVIAKYVERMTESKR